MDFLLSRIRSKLNFRWPSERGERWMLFKANLQILIKTTAMVTWLIIFVLALLEIKHYFNIDLIPGYSSAIEEVYGSVRGFVTKEVADFR